MDSPPLLHRFQNPAYTGENRCMPCTIVNVCIAVVGSALLVPLSVPLAAAVLFGSLVTISLRGYLVPGTPTLTRRYFPDWLLARFEKRPAPIGTPVEPTTVDPVEPERLLLDLDVVEPCRDVDDLCLTDAFETDWLDRIRSYRSDPRDRARVARLLDVTADDVTDVDGLAHPSFVVDGRTRRWPSDGAVIADTAADVELAGRADDWRSIPIEQRLRILEALRPFLDTCPVCDGHVTMAEERVESCCRSWEVVAVSCDDCGERLLELDPNQLEGIDGG